MWQDALLYLVKDCMMDGATPNPNNYFHAVE